MGWIGWGVVTAVVVVAYCGYRQLLGLEREIRREIEEETAPSLPPAPSAPSSSAPEVPEVDQASEEKGDKGPLNLAEERLLRLVREQPGVLQTELYARLPEIGRRFLQEQLRSMAHDGRVRRVREGGTYRVYPGE